ncbi:MAG: OmpA family protein [Gemmatimonas sp.]
MFGGRAGRRVRAQDEAEKPFWISFADLMSALMVLFLVVMSVALTSVTRKISDREQKEKQYANDIHIVLDSLKAAERDFPGLVVDTARRTIRFDSIAKFGSNSSRLSPAHQRLLRTFIPYVLRVADGETGKKMIKRVVIEGFTDTTGAYLSNLNLSLARSQRVLCSLFAPPEADEGALTNRQLQRVRQLFLVGGFSFNSAKATDAESRRVEMRVEFRGIDEPLPDTTAAAGIIGTCALGA